jgi:membrane-bound ClpP family serine protease
MNFFQEIAVLFTGMTPIVIVCLIIGLIFVIVEIFSPGFGIFGIAGSLLLLAGIVLRVIERDGNPFVQIFILLFLIAILVSLSFVIMVELSKRGFISRSPIFQKGTAVDVERSEGTEDYKSLIGKEGVAETYLRPVGKAKIGGVVYDVVADGAFFLPKGTKVKVSAIEGVRIIVVKAE